MARKAAGPKETQLREMRERSGNGVDLQSIKDSLEKLEAKHRAAMEEERNNLLKPLHEKAEEQKQIIKEAQAALSDIEHTIASITGRKAKRGGGVSGGGRQRRTAEQLKETAEQVVEFIRAKGDNGTSGAEIKERFGALLPSVKQFLESQGHKVKTSGVKASMRYHA